MHEQSLCLRICLFIKSVLTQAIEVGYFLNAVCGQRQFSVWDSIQLNSQFFKGDVWLNSVTKAVLMNLSLFASSWLI